MKFFDIIKKTTFIIACPALVFSSQWLLPDTVSADAEKEVVLSVETKEIAGNEIPSDRKIDLNVSIDKNPGFSEMYIILENTSGISFYYGDPVSGTGIYSGAENKTLDGDKNVYYSVIKGTNSAKNDSENIATVSLKLPDTVNAGDVFEIKFISAYEVGDQNYTSGFMCGENLVSFKEMKSGSIRIVEAKTTEPPATEPAPAETPAPETSHTDPPQEPEHNDQNNDNHNNGNDQNNSQETQAPEQTQPVQQTSAPVTTAVSGTTSLTASLSVSSSVSALQTAPAAVTETKKETTTAAETTVSPDAGYGEEKDDIAVNSSGDYEFEPDRTIEYILIASIIVVAVAGLFTILSILKRYKKK